MNHIPLFDCHSYFFLFLWGIADLPCNSLAKDFKIDVKEVVPGLCIAGHLSAVRKWGGKTSDYAKSGGAKPKIHGKYK